VVSLVRLFSWSIWEKGAGDRRATGGDRAVVRKHPVMDVTVLSGRSGGRFDCCEEERSLARGGSVWGAGSELRGGRLSARVSGARRLGSGWVERGRFDVQKSCVPFAVSHCGVPGGGYRVKRARMYSQALSVQRESWN